MFRDLSNSFQSPAMTWELKSQVIASFKKSDLPLSPRHILLVHHRILDWLVEEHLQYIFQHVHRVIAAISSDDGDKENVKQKENKPADPSKLGEYRNVRPTTADFIEPILFVFPCDLLELGDERMELCNWIVQTPPEERHAEIANVLLCLLHSALFTAETSTTYFRDVVYQEFVSVQVRFLSWFTNPVPFPNSVHINRELYIAFSCTIIDVGHPSMNGKRTVRQNRTFDVPSQILRVIPYSEKDHCERGNVSRQCSIIITDELVGRFAAGHCVSVIGSVLSVPPMASGRDLMELRQGSKSVVMLTVFANNVYLVNVNDRGNQRAQNSKLSSFSGCGTSTDGGSHTFQLTDPRDVFRGCNGVDWEISLKVVDAFACTVVPSGWYRKLKLMLLLSLLQCFVSPDSQRRKLFNVSPMAETPPVNYNPCNILLFNDDDLLTTRLIEYAFKMHSRGVVIAEPFDVSCSNVETVTSGVDMAHLQKASSTPSGRVSLSSTATSSSVLCAQSYAQGFNCHSTADTTSSSKISSETTISADFVPIDAGLVMYRPLRVMTEQDVTFLKALSEQAVKNVASFVSVRDIHRGAFNFSENPNEERMRVPRVQPKPRPMIIWAVFKVYKGKQAKTRALESILMKDFPLVHGGRTMVDATADVLLAEWTLQVQQTTSLRARPGQQERVKPQHRPPPLGQADFSPSTEIFESYATACEFFRDRWAHIVCMGSEALDLAQKWFLLCRRTSKLYSQTHMESMLALATSHARLNLRSTVAIVDVLVAIVATEESIASIAYHATKSAPAATSKRVSAAAVATDLWGGTEMCKTVLSKLTRHNQTDDIFIHAYEGAAPRFKCLNMFREILHLVRDSR